MTKLIEMGEVVYVMMVCGEMAMIERCNGITTVKCNRTNELKLRQTAYVSGTTL